MPVSDNHNRLRMIFLVQIIVEFYYLVFENIERLSTGSFFIGFQKIRLEQIVVIEIEFVIGFSLFVVNQEFPQILFLDYFYFVKFCYFVCSLNCSLVITGK